MKKILLTLFAVFFCWVTIFARQLTEQEAMDRALQYINSNKSYEIENLTITRKGSTDPDIPITVNDGTFDISVANWTVVPVTSGVNI